VVLHGLSNHLSHIGLEYQTDFFVSSLGYVRKVILQLFEGSVA
jgi:hypothetical protein